MVSYFWNLYLIETPSSTTSTFWIELFPLHSLEVNVTIEPFAIQPDSVCLNLRVQLREAGAFYILSRQFQ